MNKMAMMDLNRRLALLLGWSEIRDVRGAWIGQAPPGDPQCRGQALVPDWCGDWRACGALMALHRIEIEWVRDTVHANCAGSQLTVALALHDDAGAALRFAIVRMAMLRMNNACEAQA